MTSYKLHIKDAVQRLQKGQNLHGRMHRGSMVPRGSVTPSSRRVGDHVLTLHSFESARLMSTLRVHTSNRAVKLIRVCWLVVIVIDRGSGQLSW